MKILSKLLFIYFLFQSTIQAAVLSSDIEEVKHSKTLIIIEAPPLRRQPTSFCRWLCGCFYTSEHIIKKDSLSILPEEIHGLIALYLDKRSQVNFTHINVSVRASFEKNFWRQIAKKEKIRLNPSLNFSTSILKCIIAESYYQRWRANRFESSLLEKAAALGHKEAIEYLSLSPLYLTSITNTYYPFIASGLEVGPFG